MSLFLLWEFLTTLNANQESSLKTLWKILNAAVIALAKSPIHKIISRNILVLEIIGAQTGQKYKIPVSYLQIDSGLLYCVTDRKNIWWKNLRSRQDINAFYKGNLVRIKAEVDERDLRLAIDHLSLLCGHSRVDGFFAGVGYTNGQPIEADIRKVARDMIPITVRL